MILSYVSLTAVSAYLTDYPSVFNAGFQTCCPMIRPRFCQKKGSLSVLLLQKCQYHHWKQADVRGVSKVKKKKKKESCYFSRPLQLDTFFMCVYHESFSSYLRHKEHAVGCQSADENGSSHGAVDEVGPGLH